MFARFFSEELGFLESHTVEGIEDVFNILEQSSIFMVMLGIEPDYWAEVFETDEPDDVIPICLVKHDGEKYVVEYA